MILIIDIDSRIPNLALKKVVLFYQKMGEKVVWNMPIYADIADKVYVSCVFSENRHLAEEWEGRAEIGGSGYSLTKELPPEIEAIRPRINMGFTTRGCIRNCPFCIVPEKEGKFRIVGDLYDLWDEKSKDVTILDNNILADPKHFAYICKQSIYPKIRLDFNQGLDHRLLTPEICHWLRRIRHKEYRFAWDFPEDQDSVEKALKMLKEAGINRSMWYVMVGFNTTFQQDLMRLDFLRERKQTAFVMRYRKTRGNLLLGQWANKHNVFKAVSFGEFLRLPRYQIYRVKYADEVEPYLGGYYE